MSAVTPRMLMNTLLRSDWRSSGAMCMTMSSKVDCSGENEYREHRSRSQHQFVPYVSYATVRWCNTKISMNEWMNEWMTLYFNRVHNYNPDCSLPYGTMKLWTVSLFKCNFKSHSGPRDHDNYTSIIIIIMIIIIIIIIIIIMMLFNQGAHITEDVIQWGPAKKM